jgi:hypothetical protein
MWPEMAKCGQRTCERGVGEPKKMKPSHTEYASFIAFYFDIMTYFMNDHLMRLLLLLIT